MTSLRTNPPAPADPMAFRLPDIPEKHPDDMTSFKQLAEGGNQGRIESWLGRPETTIVSGERYICAAPGGPIRYTLTCWWPATPTRSCTRPTTVTWRRCRASRRTWF